MRTQRNRTAAASWIIPLFLLTQSSAALAQSKPAEPIYSDQWIEKETARLANNWGSLVAGAACAGGSYFAGQVVRAYASNPTIKKVAVPAGVALGIASAIGCQMAKTSFHISSKRDRLLQDSLDSRIRDKLALDLKRHFQDSVNGKGPYSDLFFAKGRQQVESEIEKATTSLFYQAAQIDNPNGYSGVLTPSEFLAKYDHLFTPDDRELLQYLYAIRRAAKAGLPPTAVSNVKGKRPAISGMGPSTPDPHAASAR